MGRLPPGRRMVALRMTIEQQAWEGDDVRSGKLDPALLEALLASGDSPPADGNAAAGALALGPGAGRDAAAVRLPDRYVVLAADPLTFAGPAGAADAARVGQAAVHVNANDVVCLGAEPRWFLATVLLPPDGDADDLAGLFDGLRRACASVGATLTGGHTEVSEAVSRLVVAGTMVGEAPLDRLYAPTRIAAGDALVQIGPAAIEGTALLAAEAPGALRRAGLAPETIAAAAALADDPGISVVAMARAAWDAPGLRSLHDPTEGGVATACWEMALAAGLGVEVDEAETLVHPLTTVVAEALGLDWRGLLASGCLLAAVEERQAEAFVERLRAAGESACRIGRFTAAQGGPGRPAILRASTGPRALPRFTRDEALRVLSPDG